MDYAFLAPVPLIFHMEILQIYFVVMPCAAQPGILQAYARSFYAADSSFVSVGGCVCKISLNDDAMAKTLRLLVLYLKRRRGRQRERE